MNQSLLLGFQYGELKPTKAGTNTTPSVFLVLVKILFFDFHY